MNIVFYEIEEWEQRFFQQTLSAHSLTFISEPLTEKNCVPEAEILSTFIYSTLNKTVLERLPRLVGIATRSTGMDHIDVAYCKERNIPVKNVASYGINTIAEHTFALILALSRHLIPSVERTKRGNFALDGLRGFELAGKTIGIVGLGAISTRVVELARAFRMNILVTTRHEDPQKASALGFSFTNLSTVLSTSDIVSIHVPATPETRHMINKENILQMKPGSMLINTARGAVVETEAIVLALEKGLVSGVGLDVLEEEGALKEERQLLSKEFFTTGDIKVQLLNHLLLTHEKVIITPHNAFNSTEALQEILEVTKDTIVAWL